ncbi:hypothetical protein NPIL_28411 [Nephila pilipes]|uniref:Uncharacterized protein n=1 Tax=Nephila pilipes TaxID=299642 RepID=A0A8X6N548_NEPPI|nr:hypothetical protein NPIL_28411 [Nephila pilipes]
MHLLSESNGIAISSICDFIPLLACFSALSLPFMSTCHGIHWNSTILHLITCFILLNIKDSERYWSAIVSEAEIESTRTTAFTKDSILDCTFVTAKKNHVDFNIEISYVFTHWGKL